jgi:geranylgeranyl diphosphate synthase type I
MTFDSYFEKTRKRLLSDLDEFLSAKRKGLAGLKPWGGDVIRRLAEFARKGKMIRGGLVSLGSEMAGDRISRAAVRAGTAFELIQSGLLIHDDIMDRDARRRGAPSIHEQYARLAECPGTPEAAHFGTSLAICAGEISIFLAFEALAGLPGPGKNTAAVQKLFAAEFGLVGLGRPRASRRGRPPCFSRNATSSTSTGTKLPGIPFPCPSPQAGCWPEGAHPSCRRSNASAKTSA